MLEIITDIIAAIIVIPFIVYMIKRSRKITDKEKRESIVELARQESESMKKVRFYNDWYRTYVAQYGQPDKTFTFIKNDKTGIILINEQNQKIWILGHDLTFSEIISCSIEEDTTIHKGKIIASTTTNSGSLLGRSLLGGLVAGPIGALVGGSTASTTTEFQQEDDHLVRDYTVIVTVNSISNPVIRIHTGKNAPLTKELFAIFQIICSRNSQQKNNI